jgi:magnesium-transporting ATPase (P-type)
VTKGAPEGVLESCSSVEPSGADALFTAELQSEPRRTYAELSRAGFHMLAIARRRGSHLAVANGSVPTVRM